MNRCQSLQEQINFLEHRLSLLNEAGKPQEREEQHTLPDGTTVTYKVKTDEKGNESLFTPAGLPLDRDPKTGKPTSQALSTLKQSNQPSVSGGSPLGNPDEPKTGSYGAIARELIPPATELIKTVAPYYLGAVAIKQAAPKAVEGISKGIGLVGQELTGEGKLRRENIRLDLESKRAAIEQTRACSSRKICFCRINRCRKITKRTSIIGCSTKFTSTTTT
jgi:hypothetical protein